MSGGSRSGTDRPGELSIDLLLGHRVTGARRKAVRRPAATFEQRLWLARLGRYSWVRWSARSKVVPVNHPDADRWRLLDMDGNEIAVLPVDSIPDTVSHATLWGLQTREAHGLTTAVLVNAARSHRRTLDIPYTSTSPLSRDGDRTGKAGWIAGPGVRPKAERQ